MTSHGGGTATALGGATLVATMMLASCHHGARPTPTAQADKDIVAAIDPGPQAPLADMAPHFLVSARLPDAWTYDSVVQRLRAGGAPNFFDVAIDDPATTDDVAYGAAVFLWVIDAARARWGDDAPYCLAMLAFGYRFFAGASDPEATAKRMARGARMHDNVSAEQQREIHDFALRLMGEARARTYRVTAEVVRLAPGSVQASEAEHSAAVVANHAGEHGFAADLMLDAFVRSSVHDDELTDAVFTSIYCYRAGRLACGDDYATRTRALAAADAAYLTSLEKTARNAHAVAELASAVTVDDRLHVAALDEQLERYAEARAIYEQLAHEHPEDARAAAGLARLQLLRRQFFPAYETLVHSGVEHRDAGFYRLVMGAWFMGAAGAIMNDDTAAIEGEMMSKTHELVQLVEAYAQLEPVRAAWLLYCLRIALLLFDKNATEAERISVLDHTRRAAEDTERQYPDDVPLAKLLLMLTLADADNARADLTIAEIGKRHPSDADIVTLRHAAMLWRTVRWNDTGVLPVLAAELDVGTTRESDRVQRIDVRALQTPLADRTAWASVAAAYRENAAVDEDTPEDEARRRVNNYAVALYRSGATDGASTALHALAAGGRSFDALLLNAYASAAADERETLWSQIDTARKRPSDRRLERVANAWHALFQARSENEGRRAASAVMAAPYGADPTVIEARFPGTSIVRNTIKFGANLTSTFDLSLVLSSDAPVWLVLEP